MTVKGEAGGLPAVQYLLAGGRRNAVLSEARNKRSRKRESTATTTPFVFPPEAIRWENADEGEKSDAHARS
jgi:hypothetical protein